VDRSPAPAGRGPGEGLWTGACDATPFPAFLIVRPPESAASAGAAEAFDLSFLLPCPNCGPRSVYEFDFGGEYHARPEVNEHASASTEEWARYLYCKTNSENDQTEWWYHRMGCRLWFLASRNTSTNQVHSTFWPEQLQARVGP